VRDIDGAGFAGFAAVFTVAVSAGTIASSSGRATVAPTPRRNVRRGSDNLEMNMTMILLGGSVLKVNDTP
jgi:hypothetical protein